MDLSVDYLVDLSEAWLPVALQYGAQVTLALLTFLFGWWLINTLTAKVSSLLQRRQVDPTPCMASSAAWPAWCSRCCCWSAWHR